MRLAVSLILASIALAQSDQTGSISGVVTDSVTRIPVKKAIVSVSLAGNSGGRNSAPKGAMTDESGAFTVSDLPAGRYRLSFQHQNYPQARFGGVIKSVEVKAGESTSPIAVELVPGSSVSGRVVDEDGDPVTNCSVQVRPPNNPEGGVPMTGNTNSDDDGVYRLFGIAPGKYLMTANCFEPVFQPRPFSAGPDPPPTRAYPVQYYPLAASRQGAQLVELTAGAEKSGIDFQMAPAHVTQIHGIFSRSGADWHGVQLNLQLISLDGRNVANGPAIDEKQGTFNFFQVFPGSYKLTAFSGRGEDDRIGASQRIDVGDQPVETTLELHRGFDLTGKVEIENSGNSANPLPLNQIGIQLVPQPEGGFPHLQGEVGADGTFAVKSVVPGSWKLQLNAPAFIRSAWLGSSDVTNAPMELSGGAAATLKIVISTNLGSIHGSAPSAQTVLVQLLPEEGPVQFTRGAQVDTSGQFTFASLPPGKYRVIAQDNGMIPEEGGQEVLLHEGETIVVDLKAAQ